jgi:hypothetical protein
MGITNMSRLNQVKLHGRDTADHGRALIERALKLLDEADAKHYGSAAIARRTGLPVSPLRDEGKRRKQCPDWTSTSTLWGQQGQKLSHAEESALAEFIRSEVLIGRLIFQDADFRASAMAAWFEKERHRDHMKPFNYSADYISDFKKCHRFTSRAFHSKRRPSATADWQEQS